MTKKTNKPKQVSVLHRIFRFFFPKNFLGEVKKGIEMGKVSEASKRLHGGMYEAGKALRRKVDPEHEMKIGSQRKKK